MFQYESGLLHAEICLKQNLFHVVTYHIFINIFLIIIFLQFFCINCIFTILFKILGIFHKFPFIGKRLNGTSTKKEEDKNTFPYTVITYLK